MAAVHVHDAREKFASAYRFCNFADKPQTVQQTCRTTSSRSLKYAG